MKYYIIKINNQIVREYGLNYELKGDYLVSFTEDLNLAIKWTKEEIGSYDGELAKDIEDTKDSTINGGIKIDSLELIEVEL